MHALLLDSSAQSNNATSLLPYINGQSGVRWKGPQNITKSRMQFLSDKDRPPEPACEVPMLQCTITNAMTFPPNLTQPSAPGLTHENDASLLPWSQLSSATAIVSKWMPEQLCADILIKK